MGVQCPEFFIFFWWGEGGGEVLQSLHCKISGILVSDSETFPATSVYGNVVVS